VTASAIGLVLMILAAGNLVPLHRHLATGMGLALVFAVMGLEGSRPWPRPWPTSGWMAILGLALMLIGLELAWFVRAVPWILSIAVAFAGLALQIVGLRGIRAKRLADEARGSQAGGSAATAR